MLCFLSDKYLRVVPTQASYFEINVGKRRIRHKTILNFNDTIFNQFWDEKYEIKFEIKSRSIAEPPLSRIDFENKMAWVLASRRVLFAEKHIHKHLIFPSIVIKPRDTNLIPNLAWQSIFMGHMVRFDHFRSPLDVNGIYNRRETHEIQNGKREIENIYHCKKLQKWKL